MEVAPAVVAGYLSAAYDRMLVVADRLGDDLVNRRPHGARTNSVAALITHCLGVTEFWVGHVGLRRPSDRDREAEFGATATVAELRERVAAGVARACADLDELLSGGERGPHPEADDLPGGDGTVSLALHVLEELYQHLGHMELTADALGVTPR